LSVEVQHNKLVDELTLQYPPRGMSMENLQVLDIEIVSALKVSRNGSVEVEQGRKPQPCHL
jgi:hypothetical protein